MQKVIERPSKSTPALTSEILTITPDIARSMLDQNVNNRKPKRGSIEAYARAMQDGRWLLTGDAIRFDTERNLLDGQHRLLACIRADTPFTTVVIYNLPKEAGLTIDTNVPRRGADVLTMAGYKSASTTAAAARWLIHWHNGHCTPYAAGAKNVGRVTNQEFLAALDRHPLLNAAVVRAIRKKPTGCNITLMGVIFYTAETLLAKPEQAAAFLDVFATGIPSREGCPAQLYRERILKSLAGSAPRPSLESAAFGLIHAWNLFADGTSITTFRFPTNDVWMAHLDRKKL